MLAQVTHQRHLVQAGLGAALLHFGQALGLLLGGDFQRFQVLEGIGQVQLGSGIFALDFLQRGAQVFAPRLDGTQEGRKGQAADIAVTGALLPVSGRV